MAVKSLSLWVHTLNNSELIKINLLITNLKSMVKTIYPKSFLVMMFIMTKFLFKTMIVQMIYSLIDHSFLSN